jgi:hypothetical protein
VPLVAAAVCPHPPLLVPEIAAGAAGELDGLRTACAAAVDSLLAARPDTLVVIGADTPPWADSFAPWGVPLPAGAGGASGYGPQSGPARPLSLLVAAWLLRRARTSASAMHAVALDLDPAGCARLGADLTAGADRVGLLVMGDGSACRGEKSPGYADERAEPFDAAAEEALAKADPDALLALDASLAAALGAVGRAPWQVLAGAAAGRIWRGELRYASAPYGVAYFVASWEPA